MPVHEHSELFVGPYRLVRRLNEGSAGRRWLASGPDATQVVVDEIPTTLCRTPGIAERLKADVQVLASLTHPNVVRVRECVQDNGSLFVVSDLVEGPSLPTAETSPYRLSPVEACHLLAGVLDGLSCLHDHGLAHGDVKPQSILVDARGTPKLTDFAQIAVTGDGPAVGASPPYMSPEVALGRPVDRRSDVYSAGAVLYQALTGRLPSTEDSDAEFPPPVQPPEMDLVLRRALAKDPRFRYQSASIFAAELRKACAHCYGAYQDAEAPAAGLESASLIGAKGADDAMSQWSSGDIDRPRCLERRSPHRRAVLAATLAVAVAAGVITLAGLQIGRPSGIFSGNAHRSAQTGRASIAKDVGGEQDVANWSGVTAPSSGFSSPTGIDPDVLGSEFTPDTELVSCPTFSFCVAVGPYADQSTSGVLDTYSSGMWTATGAPTGALDPPASVSSAGSSIAVVRLDAVSCPADGWCVAVGSYQDGAGISHGLIETFADGSWSDTSAPGVGPSSTLDRVTCRSAGSCAAVGDLGSSGAIWTLVSGKWAATSAPIDGLNPPSGTTYPPRLTDVSCPTSTSCVAVGVYYSSGGEERGLIETLSSGTWRASTAPLTRQPANAGEEFSLQDVSCPTSSFCVAMGGFYDRSGFLHGLVDTFEAGSWKSSNTPVDGLDLSYTSPQWVYILSLACSSENFCLATGWYFASSSFDEVHSFILTFSDGKWTVSRPQVGNLSPAAGNSLDVVPWAVTCEAPASCVAVGTYYDASGKEFGLIETLSKGRWASTTAPTTGLSPSTAADPGLQLNAVSCPTGPTCFAVGIYQDSAGNFRGVIEQGLG